MAMRISIKDWDFLKKKNPHMSITPMSDSPQPPFKKESDIKELVVPVQTTKTGVVLPITTDIDKLKYKLESIDDLVKSNTITQKRADEWKSRVLDQFEQQTIPAPIEKKLPNDVSHLPGRIIMGGVDALKAIARGSGATYEGLSRHEGYDPKTGDRVQLASARGRSQQQVPQKRSKSPQEIMDDLPDIYKY